MTARMVGTKTLAGVEYRVYQTSLGQTLQVKTILEFDLRPPLSRNWHPPVANGLTGLISGVLGKIGA